MTNLESASLSKTSDIIKQGTLYKWTNFVHGWQSRWFVLKQPGVLAYYKSDSSTECRASLLIFRTDTAHLYPHPLEDSNVQIADNNNIELMAADVPTSRYANNKNGALFLPNSMRPQHVTIRQHPTDTRRFDIVYDLQCGSHHVWYLRAVDTHTACSWAQCIGLLLHKANTTASTSRSISCESLLEDLRMCKDHTIMLLEFAYRMLEMTYKQQSTDSSRSGSLPEWIESIISNLPPLDEACNTIIKCLQDDADTDHHFAATNIADNVIHSSHQSETVQNFPTDGVTLEPTVMTTFENSCTLSDTSEDNFYDAPDDVLFLSEQQPNNESLRSQSVLSHLAANTDTTSIHYCSNDSAVLDADNCSTQSVETDHLVSDMIRVTAESLKRTCRSDFLADNPGWKLFASDGDMKLYKQEQMVLGLAVDPLIAKHRVYGITARELCVHFWDPDRRLEWDSTVESVLVLGNIDDSTAVNYQLHKRVWPTAKRDSLFWSRLTRFRSDDSTSSHQPPFSSDDSKNQPSFTHLAPSRAKRNGFTSFVDNFCAKSYSVEDSRLPEHLTSANKWTVNDWWAVVNESLTESDLGKHFSCVRFTETGNYVPETHFNIVSEDGLIRISLSVCLAARTHVTGSATADVSRDQLVTDLTYSSVVHPGGWVHPAALRHVYRREYPRFLKTFTAYVRRRCMHRPILW